MAIKRYESFQFTCDANSLSYYQNIHQSDVVMRAIGAANSIASGSAEEQNKYICQYSEI